MRVDVRASIEGRERRFLRFEVRDTGVGVPTEKREEIFEEFVQADSSHARKFGGSGLGLAISKRLVEAMGGEIGIEEAAGGGSQFWFTMPASSSRGANCGRGAPLERHAHRHRHAQRRAARRPDRADPRGRRRSGAYRGRRRANRPDRHACWSTPAPAPSPTLPCPAEQPTSGLRCADCTGSRAADWPNCGDGIRRLSRQAGAAVLIGRAHACAPLAPVDACCRHQRAPARLRADRPGRKQQRRVRQVARSFWPRTIPSTRC